MSQLWALALGVMGLGLALAALFIYAYLPEFKILMHSDPLHFGLSICLALVTISLFFAYIIATRYELELLYDYLGDVMPMPRLKPKVYVITFGLAIVFAILVALSRNLLAYSAFIVTYNLFDLWGSWEVAKTIGRPLDKKLRIERDAKQRQELQTIWDYYFSNPTIPRIVTMMFVDWIVVCLALLYVFTNENMLRTGGYVLLLFNIIIAELIIYRWRRRSIYKRADPSWVPLHRRHRSVSPRVRRRQ